jgi:hypothetical protein
MRLLLSVGVLCVVVTSQSLTACGDKFLGAGRGVRFGRVYAALHPGRVLLYSPDNGPIAKLRRSGLDKAIRRAGHQVDVAEDRGSLYDALRQRPVDVVIVDDANAPDVGRVAGSMQAGPSVMPLTQDTLISFLKALDGTMKSRLQLPGRKAAL